MPQPKEESTRVSKEYPAFSFERKWQELYLSIKRKSFIYKGREPHKHAQTSEGAPAIRN